MPKADADPAGELGRLLNVERDALLAGDLAALAGLIARKDKLLTLLESAPVKPPEAALRRLRESAFENQQLLDAALRGVRAARARLDTVRGGGPALSTYDANGRAESHGASPSSVERRA